MTKTKVLVVEDSRTQAQELVMLLESEGFEVASALDGRAGLEQCQRGLVPYVGRTRVEPRQVA